MCLYSLDQKQKNRPSETFNIDSDSKLIAFEICGQQTCIRKRDLILDASALHRKKNQHFLSPRESSPPANAFCILFGGHKNEQ